MLYKMENFAMKLTKNDLIGDLQAWAKAYFLHINTLNYSKNTILLYLSLANEDS